MVHHLIFPPCDGNDINGKLELFSPEISLLRELPVSCPNYSTWKKCVQFTEQGKCGLISLEMIFGGHMMRILHRMVYNMLMVMLVQFSTLHCNGFSVQVLQGIEKKIQTGQHH
ncbi:uncharacterized protein [Apostichopus japonicus]|uniref:uncharacterized protein isoform X2 n=1 Tax=Stichopus japonicus TaxID=307972 RepID=UPI003AB748FC